MCVNVYVLTVGVMQTSSCCCHQSVIVYLILHLFIRGPSSVFRSNIQSVLLGSSQGPGSYQGPVRVQLVTVYCGPVCCTKIPLVLLWSSLLYQCLNSRTQVQSVVVNIGLFYQIPVATASLQYWVPVYCTVVVRTSLQYWVPFCCTRDSLLYSCSVLL